jgi:DNA replication protein DnaC
MPSTSTPECQFCGGTGWRPGPETGTKGPLIPCDCRERARIDRAIEGAGIPLKYQTCDFNDFDCRWEGHRNETLWKALGHAQKFVDEYGINAQGLLFLGPPGTGKTHLMVALLRKLCEKGADAVFLDYQELLRQIQNSYNPAAHTREYELLQPVLSSDIVAIDDLGNNRISDWVEDTVTYIVNHRYSRNLPTLFTANLSEERMEGVAGQRVTQPSFEERLGPRVASRLREMCRFVEMKSADYRRFKAGVR